MAELEEQGCNSQRVDDLKEILEKIGNKPKLLAKYKDIYNAAADALMLGGVQASDCKCDPLRNHIPDNKKIDIF